MRVDNIFELTNKSRKEEDQLSANFGFILKNNKEILNLFLKEIGIKLLPKELKQVDIETQISYNSNESKIDLQLTVYSKFLVFIESKLYKNDEDKIFEQLNKYKNILYEKKAEYTAGIRLVYVNKFDVDKKIIEKLRTRLNVSKKEFFFFTWEDLIKLDEKYSKKETVRLFHNYIQDAMYNKKEIKEQKIKDIVELLVVYTNPIFWELANKKNIVVQNNMAPDAKYIAFLRTHRDNKKRSAITHIAEVKYTEKNVPVKNSFKGFPELIKDATKKKYIYELHKEYHLDNIIELAKEIPSIKGPARGQVYFQTKMSELIRVNNISEIKIPSKLRN